MKIVKNKKNMIILIGIVSLLLIVSVLSYTYAYFAFSATNTDSIKGDAGVPKLDLTIEKVVPTESNSSLRLVPLLDNAIGNAVAGTGGKSSCIDANGNLSCQIYKVTAKNVGTINFIAKGTIELSASGSNNIFQNLKWRKLNTVTTVKTDAPVNGMAKSTLIENETITVNETKTYYFTLWITEINQNQSEKDYGDFKGTVYFEDNSGTGVTATFNS